MGLIAFGVGLGCTTDDVTTDVPDERNLYPIPDLAFGEYLEFRGVPGLVVNDDSAATRYSIDIDEVDEVLTLNLSKTTSAVEELTAANVATADQKIEDLDGIQHFVGLEELTITSNSVTALDTTALVSLVRLEMNFNLVGSLDLSQNVALEVLRYRASSSAADGQRLTRINLQSNTALRHLFLPGHDLTAIDLTANTAIDQVLDLSDNPGPDGDRETPDIVVPAAIYDQVPESDRAGVTSDADAPVQLSLTADMTTLSEAGATANLTAQLNKTSSVAVSLSLETSGSATDGEDYSLDTTMLTIPAGMMSAAATLTTIDDSDTEGEETVTVTATNVTGAQAGSVTVDITITDDDGVLPLILNEVLYDPPDDAPGDANGDGTRDANEDEFVEIVNDSDAAVDISGFTFYDTEALEMEMPRHTVPAGTMLAPRQAFVLFGGGSAVGDFGGALVQIANGFDSEINLNNSGDVLTVRNASGATILTFDVEPLSNNPNESYTRAPDLTGEFEQHGRVEEGVLYSPGTRADGSSF
jgi:hypothetical protein